MTAAATLHNSQKACEITRLTQEDDLRRCFQIALLPVFKPVTSDRPGLHVASAGLRAQDGKGDAEAATAAVYVLKAPAPAANPGTANAISFGAPVIQEPQDFRNPPDGLNELRFAIILGPISVCSPSRAIHAFELPHESAAALIPLLI